VKLLFDENLSPRLVSLLADVFPGSAHVFDSGLGNSDDEEIWEYARKNGYTLVSKDSDFQERSVLGEGRPKLIWVRTSNSSSQHIAALLRSASPAILAFEASETETCLILSRLTR